MENKDFWIKSDYSADIYVAIIKGPEAYLPGGIMFERFEIYRQDMDDFLEEGGTEEEAIKYYKEEYAAEWEQRWCSVTFLNESEFNSLYGSVQGFFEDNEDDGEEEEEEEDEWGDWK